MNFAQISMTAVRTPLNQTIKDVFKSSIVLEMTMKPNQD